MRTIQNILCVDDDVVARMITQRALEQSGFEKVVPASSFEEARDILSSFSPDLILLDYFMPEMNGDAFLRHLRDLNVEAPVIFVSGSCMEKQVFSAQSLNVIGAIKKPYTAEQLYTHISSLLAKRNAA